MIDSYYISILFSIICSSADGADFNPIVLIIILLLFDHRQYSKYQLNKFKNFHLILIKRRVVYLFLFYFL